MNGWLSGNWWFSLCTDCKSFVRAEQTQANLIIVHLQFFSTNSVHLSEKVKAVIHFAEHWLSSLKSITMRAVACRYGTYFQMSLMLVMSSTPDLQHSLYCGHKLMEHWLWKTSRVLFLSWLYSLSCNDIQILLALPLEFSNIKHVLLNCTYLQPIHHKSILCFIHSHANL